MASTAGSMDVSAPSDAGGTRWPVLDGAYVLGDVGGPVAVCALTSEALVEPLGRVEGVAIAGKVYTANLGIERIVVNVTANPAIRFLLLCGKDSKLFRPGQSLGALLDNGIDEQARIVGGEGYEPVVAALSPAQVERFRRQIELVDRTGEVDLDILCADVAALSARNPGRFEGETAGAELQAEQPREPEHFAPIRPGGKREPLQYDPKGYFVITLDREQEEIVVRHYLPDHSPAHEMRGRLAGTMLLGLLREGLISQLSHAGYLGEELAKAQAALTLDLRYDQDRPLRRMPGKAGNPAATTEGAADGAAKAPKPRIQPPLSRTQFASAADDEIVNVTLAVTKEVSEREFGAMFLEPSEADPFSSFARTDLELTFFTSSSTQTVMGSPADVVAGAIVRVRGPLRKRDQIEAQGVVILTTVATVT